MSVGAQNAHEVDLLIERMRIVRSAGYSHADELQGEAKRLVDWKEYVLTKPLLSVVAASFLGFAITRTTINGVHEPKPLNAVRTPTTGGPQNGSLIGGVVNLATTIASSAIKSYVTSFVKRIISERSSTSDRLQELNSKV